MHSAIMQQKVRQKVHQNNICEVKNMRNLYEVKTIAKSAVVMTNKTVITNLKNPHYNDDVLCENPKRTRK